MKKHLPHISKILLTSIIVFGVSIFISPDIIDAQTGFEFNTNQAAQTQIEAGNNSWASIVIESGLKFIANSTLTLASYISGLAGIILNGVILSTVVNISNNYANIDSIASTWKVVRDIANMVFIFVLLYAAIKQIIGASQDNQKLIVRVITVAILINFSLFFTRVVIDISNVLALTFYDAIAPNALSIDTNWTKQAGLSNAFMQHLNLQTLWRAPDLNSATIITIGVMGTIMLLVAAFVFFAVALLFVIRYVILILVLVLSPIAFVSYVLPSGTQIEQYRKQWVDALLGQSFFAPIYFMLTWVTLNVLSGITRSFEIAFGASAPERAQDGLGGIASVIDGTLDSGAFVMLINFIVVIVLLIASLIVAKSWADRAGGGMSKLTSWVTGAAGGATVGLVGLAGRNTFGRLAEARTNNQGLKDRAAAGNKWAQLQLYGARKTAGSSFDFRATKAGGATVGVAGAGKAAGKGGFTEFKKKQAEAEEKYAKSLAPGDEVIDQAEQELKRAKTSGIASRIAGAQKKVDELKGINDDRAKEIIRTRYKGKDEEYYAYLKSDFGKAEITKLKKDNKGTAEKRKQAYATNIEKSFLAKIGGYNKAAAAQIRKGKSKKDKLAEATKEFTQEGGETATGEVPPLSEPESPASTGPTSPETSGSTSTL